MHHRIQKIVSYHNFHSFLPICISEKILNQLNPQEILPNLKKISNCLGSLDVTLAIPEIIAKYGSKHARRNSICDVPMNVRII